MSKEEEAQRLKEQGNASLKKGDLQTSIELYSKSINLHPTCYSYGNRALAYFKLKKFEKSIEDATKSLSLNEAYAKGYMRRADAYQALEKYDLALSDVEKFVSLDPNNSKVIQQLEKLKEITKPNGK